MVRKITLHHSLISPNTIFLDNLSEVVLVDIINYSQFLYKLVNNFDGIHLIILNRRQNRSQILKKGPLINTYLKHHPRCSFVTTNTSEEDAVNCHITSLISQLDHFLPKETKITIITRDYFVREVICQLSYNRKISAPFLKSDFVLEAGISPVFLTYYEEICSLNREQLVASFINVWTGSIIDFCKEHKMSRKFFALWLKGIDPYDEPDFNLSAIIAVRSLLINYKPDILVNEKPNFWVERSKSFCMEVSRQNYKKIIFSFGIYEGGENEIVLVFLSHDECILERSTDKYKILRTIIPSSAAKKHLVIMTATYLNLTLPKSIAFDLSGVGISELEETLFHRCRES